MTIRQIIARLGGIVVVAKSCGLRPVSIRNWIMDDYIPRKHHETIKEMGKRKGIKLTSKELDPYETL